MTDRYKILTSPFFLVGLGLLLLNDFCLKTQFGNWWTGKLSDISGLFIFPLFLTVLLPRKTNLCFILTAVIFTLWKLPTANIVIQFFNDLGLPVGRTVDITDLMTLAILPAAYYYQKSSFQPVNLNVQAVAIISLFAFSATTLAPREKRKYSNINKTYHFDYSPSVLIDKLNRLTVRKINKQPLYAGIQFDSEGDLFYYKLSGDTLAVLLDSKIISNQDTIHYETVLADFVINGNDSISSLTFISAYKVVPKFSDKDYREKAIKEFERKVVKKLKRKN